MTIKELKEVLSSSGDEDALVYCCDEKGKMVPINITGDMDVFTIDLGDKGKIITLDLLGVYKKMAEEDDSR